MEDFELLLSKLYKETNYKIVDFDNKSELCLIVFSSNGLYSPNNYDQLLSVYKNTKFEYDKILDNIIIKKYFKRIIFVRDVLRHFYMNGINNKINSVAKTFDLLNKLTEGYKCYTLGNSSGGFVAILAGSYMPNVVRVYSAGGVVDPLNWHGPYFDYNFNELDYVKELDEIQKNDLRLDSIIETYKIPVYSFYACYSKADSNLIEFIDKFHNGNFKNILLKTKNHGDYIWSYDYAYLLTKNENRLNKLFSKCKKPISKIRFSIKNQGVVRFINNYLKYKKIHKNHN